MNKDKQRIAIAEACGYQQLLGDPYRGKAWMPKGWTIEKFIRRGEPAIYVDGLPDYLNDLNAMHEAEKIIFERMKWEQYNHLLKEAAGIAGRMVNYAAHATAAQRAEAFLKTLNLWKDNEKTN